MTQPLPQRSRVSTIQCFCIQLPLVSLSFPLYTFSPTRFHHQPSLTINLSTLSFSFSQDQESRIKITAKPSKMTLSRVHQQAIAFPAAKTATMSYLPDPPSINKLQVPTSSKFSFLTSKGKSMLRKKKTDSFTKGARDQDKLEPKLSETVKRKLSLGAKILQMGGLEKIYKRLFKVCDEEKLFKAYQCYLSTTAGPISGLLFISSKKIAFCSERSIKVVSPHGDISRVHYKVSIPLSKINGVNQSQNTKKPSKKYLEVVTVDNFDFWFMGFVSYRKAFNCLEQALNDDDQ
ncbi:PREDICTED: GEM-like protein 6 [Camelina sativa]|uniref:GEM-like protein 6 n=1 Tax=Camelina sativa TaxID=90675 RepID=A0ABM1RDX3_CAMSA|nr:PREDICTED: GEM-like protein 6 [Camelina sativa]